MSTATYSFPPAKTEVRGQAARTASWLLPAFVALVIVVVYSTPITKNWITSTQEYYAVSMDDMEASAEAGNRSRQVAFLFLGAVGALGVWYSDSRHLRIHGWLDIMCITYVVWCGLSLIWALDPSVSVRRYALLICEACAAMAIAKHVTPRQMVGIVLACTMSWLTLGVIAELSLGTLRPWESEYRFAGIFHPNEMGVQCAIAVMAAVFLFPLARGAWRPALIFAACFAGALLYLTGSRTALMVTALCLTAGWMGGAIAHRRFGVLLALIWVGVLSVFVFQDTIFRVTDNTALIGRSDSDMSSLTGRIPLWEELTKYISERPLIGGGYGGFWSPDHIRELSDKLDWSISSAHSSYMELALDVGLIGAVFCVAGFLLALHRSFLLEASLPGEGYVFLSVILLCTLISGLTETTFGIAGARPFFAMCAVALIAAGAAKQDSTDVVRSVVQKTASRKVAPRWAN